MSSTSHPKHDSDEIRWRNPTNISMRESQNRYMSKMIILTGRSSREELRRSETLEPKRATPTVG